MLADFDLIIGHEKQVNCLKKALETGNIAHAYCFFGPKSVGKATIAEYFVDNLNIVKADVSRLKPNEKGVISVNNVRDLRERLSMSALGGGRKMAIIDGADKMTVQAQNALLKTLEEPRGETTVILIAEDASKLLPTIMSRTANMRFTLVSHELLSAAMERLGHPREVAGLAAGRPGTALRLVDADARADVEQRIAWALGFINSSIAERFSCIESIVKNKDITREQIEESLSAIGRTIHDCMLASVGCEEPVSHAENIKSIALSKKPAAWALALSKLDESVMAIKQNINPQIAFEHFALSF